MKNIFKDFKSLNMEFIVMVIKIRFNHRCFTTHLYKIGVIITNICDCEKEWSIKNNILKIKY